ncbi:sulfite exporter TauE/SafE family protein [Tellurirhabdus rosea]|uniref:sulfite exporter TauE/SafE family protein n=1 Tax=Tellurirhabdus rosea TaxID=2674997 RepID=UPI00224F7CF4|nr:sulfite exporter TauE/SafE family protein [Tellurirhabdus rosea]
MNPWYYTALLTGLAGSLHCVGMCGPLAMALPIGRLPRWQRAGAVLLYHAGRVSAYALLGTLMGTVGRGLVLTGLQQPISIGAGLLLLFWTLTSRAYPEVLRSTWLGRTVTRPMMQLLHAPSLGNFLGMGFLNGLLPCGFVYVAMAGSLANSSATEGAAYMALFGLGTLPALLGIRFVPELLPVKLRQKFSKALPVMTLVVALLLIVRGVMPYVAAGHPTGEGPEVPSAPLCHRTK